MRGWIIVKALPGDDGPKWAPPDNAIKILLLGEGGVGRTTLAYKYVYGDFVPDTVMTKGIQVHFKDITLGGKMYALHLWDLAGQDRFRFMHPTYVKGARGAIFFYDLTRIGTIDNIEEWVQIARTYDKDLPVMMCALKPDLVDERSVDEEYARTFLQPLRLFDFIEASSKTGKNADLVFETMTRKILELAPPRPAKVRKAAKKKAPRPARKKTSINPRAQTRTTSQIPGGTRESQPVINTEEQAAEHIAAWNKIRTSAIKKPRKTASKPRKSTPRKKGAMGFTCEHCGASMPSPPTKGQDITCPECHRIWRVHDL